MSTINSHRKLKILIIANYNPGKGGISGVVQNHFTKLNEEGFTANIFNTKKPFFKRLFLLFPLIVKVRNFHVIHIHGCSDFGFYPIFIGIIASKFFLCRKTIITYHGGGAEEFLKKHSGFIKWVVEKADYITVMSFFLKNTFAKYNINTLILKNLINIKENVKAQAVIDVPRLLSIRSLTDIYNIQDIIFAFQLLKKIYPEATLEIAGSGNLESTLKQQAKKTSGIRFLGQISNDEIPKLLKRNNVLISVPSFDNQPMSILEAFSMGIPVISSRVGGIPDMIEDSINGFLVDVNAPEQIYNKILWIFSNQDQMPRIINNAQESVKAYQWPVIQQQLLTLYQN